MTNLTTTTAVAPVPTAPVSAAPCHCGCPIPAGRVAYCSDRCRWADDIHEHYDYTEDAA